MQLLAEFSLRRRGQFNIALVRVCPKGSERRDRKSTCSETSTILPWIFYIWFVEAREVCYMDPTYHQECCIVMHFRAYSSSSSKTLTPGTSKVLKSVKREHDWTVDRLQNARREYHTRIQFFNQYALLELHTTGRNFVNILSLGDGGNAFGTVLQVCRHVDRSLQNF